MTLNLEAYVSKADSDSIMKTNMVILIDLLEQRLYLVNTDSNSIVKSYSIASGKLSSPSPVGTWEVTSMGEWDQGFGTRWIGLNVPWGKYGIHGTNNPQSIGREASHGCIRMFNIDVEELYKYVKPGMLVVIYAGPHGSFEKGFRTLKPGDRGAAVYETQRKLKDRGYYPGIIDGVYGEVMKKYVIKFRKDNNLSISHNVDYEFYQKLGISLLD